MSPTSSDHTLNKVTAPAGDANDGPVSDAPPRSKPKARTYAVSLVGEQHYQVAVRACRVGDPVTVWHEPDNPYDELALVVSDARGRTIGYVPKSAFLVDAIHEEGKACRATIGFLGAGDKGFTHVSIDAELCVGPIGTRGYSAR